MKITLFYPSMPDDLKMPEGNLRTFAMHVATLMSKSTL